MFNLFLFFTYSSVLIYKMALPLKQILTSEWYFVSVDAALKTAAGNYFDNSILLPVLIIFICLAVAAGFTAMTSTLIDRFRIIFQSLFMPKTKRSLKNY